MSKCGKGCMPECEYFVTCGCISPFNCPYKIEENFKNSAFTTRNSNFLSGIEKWFKKLVEEGKIPQTPMNYDTASYKAYVAHLEAENAALRERLDKAVELPVKIGDRVFCIVGQKPAVEEFEVIEIKTQSSSLSHTMFVFQGIDVGYRTVGFLSGYGKRWFTELEAAEKRLAELGGKK